MNISKKEFQDLIMHKQNSEEIKNVIKKNFFKFEDEFVKIINNYFLNTLDKVSPFIKEIQNLNIQFMYDILEGGHQIVFEKNKHTSDEKMYVLDKNNILENIDSTERKFINKNNLSNEKNYLIEKYSLLDKTAFISFKDSDFLINNIVENYIDNYIILIANIIKEESNSSTINIRYIEILKEIILNKNIDVDLLKEEKFIETINFNKNISINTKINISEKDMKIFKNIISKEKINKLNIVNDFFRSIDCDLLILSKLIKNNMGFDILSLSEVFMYKLNKNKILSENYSIYLTKQINEQWNEIDLEKKLKGISALFYINKYDFFDRLINDIEEKNIIEQKNILKTISEKTSLINDKNNEIIKLKNINKIISQNMYWEDNKLYIANHISNIISSSRTYVLFHKMNKFTEDFFFELVIIKDKEKNENIVFFENKFNVDQNIFENKIFDVLKKIKTFNFSNYDGDNQLLDYLKKMTREVDLSSKINIVEKHNVIKHKI